MDKLTNQMTEIKQKKCPTCGYQGADLVRIRDCARNRMLCQYCVNQDGIGDDAMNMIDRLASHQAAGTLDEYPSEQRLEDLRGGGKRETIQ